MSEHADYVRKQFERLDGSARYGVKVRGSEGETHWMSVSPATARKLAAVLAEDNVRVGEQPEVKTNG